MARVKSIGRQVEELLNQKSGIGESKLQARNTSGLTSLESHQKISPKIHSYKSLSNIRNELTNLGKFAKSELGIREIKDIDITVVKAWLEQKNINYRTASNYLSNLNKVSDALSLQKSEIATLRQTLQQTLAKPQLTTRAYDLTHVQIAPRSEIPYTLQKEYGLRVSASIRINLATQLNQNTLSFKQKGGKLSEITLTSTLASKIRENALNGKFELNYRTYYRDLKKAIEAAGQTFNGTHGMRHTFAQSKLQHHTKQEVSAFLGHSREEITLVYLR